MEVFRGAAFLTIFLLVAGCAEVKQTMKQPETQAALVRVAVQAAVQTYLKDREFDKDKALRIVDGIESTLQHTAAGGYDWTAARLYVNKEVPLDYQAAAGAAFEIAILHVDEALADKDTARAELLLNAALQGARTGITLASGTA